MKKFTCVFALIFVLCFCFGCTSMSRTQQGFASGAILGAAAGTGIALAAGGMAGFGALAGAAIGGVGGGLYGYQQETRYW